MFLCDQSIRFSCCIASVINHKISSLAARICCFGLVFVRRKRSGDREGSSSVDLCGVLDFGLLISISNGEVETPIEN